MGISAGVDEDRLMVHLDGGGDAVEYRSAQSAPHITCSYWPSDHEGVQARDN